MRRRVYEGSEFDVSVEDGVEIVEHPGSVAVVAVDTEGFVTLVRQYRAPAGGDLLELPAGKVDEGEAPLDAARRELAEETGLTGGEWRELARFYTTPGFCDETMRVFVATGCERGEASPDADEEIELVRIPLGQVAETVAEIDDGKTVTGLLLYLREIAESG